MFYYCVGHLHSSPQIFPDLPVVMSKKHVGIADPHQRLQLVRQEGVNRAGKLVKLSEFMEYQGHASSFVGVFDMAAGKSNYDATLFRFPLRQEDSESKISPNCYTPAKVHDNLFSSLQTEAPILLLFLKHVVKVSMYEWNEASEGPVCMFSVEISDNVMQDRVKCTSLAQAYTKSSAKVSVVLTSATTTCYVGEEEPSQYHWLMLNSIGSDLEKLRAHADETNVLPWVGIAARAPIKFNVTEQIVIDIEDISGVNSIKTVVSKLDTILQKHTCEAGGFVDISTTAGQAFCFLPLPGSISLPVNLHGYFAVADNRRSIKWPSHDEKGEEAKWNEILLHKLISPLYALLLICRSSLIQYCGTSIDNPAADAYAAWPVYAEVKNQQIWSEILQPVLTRIVNLPVLWTEACDGTWVTPNEAFFINPDEACPQVALKVLVELGYKVVSLPLEILETMLKNEEMKEIITRRYVTAELVQNSMRNRKGILHSVPKEQVYQLLEYVLSYQPNLNPCVLIGLEVLPLSDNSLCQFTANGYGVSNHVFVFPEKYKHCLEFLPGISSSVVATRIPVGLQEKLEELSKKGQLQLKLVTPDIICGQLIKLSMKSWSLNLDSKCIWKPGQSNHPPMEWIENVWTWIRISKAVQQVCMYSVPIVPKEIVAACTKQVCLLPLNASPGLCTLHRETLPEQCPLDVMLEIVGMVGLLHVQQSDYVSQCPGTDHYIKTCDAQFLLLHIRNKLPSFSKELTSADKDVLRHFIACDFYAKQPSSQETKTIKSLPIFKAGVGGSPSQYLSLNSLNCVLPPPGITFQEDIEYPPYILCDEGGRVTALLEMLKIARSHTVDEFCMSIILPHVTQKARWSDNDEKLVMWVLQLPLTNPTFLESFSIVRPCASGHERKKPNELYDPSDDVFCNLFDPQSEAAFPANEYKLVLPVLRQAGLKTWSGIKNDSEKRVKFFVGRANSVSKLSKSKGLARSKNLLPHLLHMGIIQDSQFSMINFLFPQESPPADYPSKLKWYGKDMPQAMCPQDIYCNTSEACLIGSIVPILSSEYRVQGKHPGFHKITAKDIIRHFWEVVSFVSKTEITESDGDKVHEMVMKIYRSLSNQKSITEFPRQWIWWRNTTTFLTPEQCVFTLPTDIATLEPYLFCLSVNPELQARVSSLLPLLPLQMQLQQSLSNEDAVTVLNKMNLHKGKHLTPEEVSMAVRILQWLKKHDYQTRGDIVIPTTMSTLALVSECTYDDRNWKAHTLLASKYTFVHEDIPPALAKHLRVTPLSQKLAPSKKLQLKYTKAGQHEPITRRIRGLVEGYATSSDIFKELLQNADDAGATEVKFLIDWREHPTTSLLANELQDWQGPALIAYNNSVFSDQDFDHICELAAETKMKDPLKTGRFGVGFCAIYHLTDVPSFISRRYFTMFDPHTSYLGERVSEGQPGMRIDLVESREDLTVCADQFQPYNGLFGCDVFNLSGSGFQGTLFRFPFRSSKTANKSSISREVNDRRSVVRLIQNFREQASYLLLFLKHVRNIYQSLYLREDQETCLKW